MKHIQFLTASLLLCICCTLQAKNKVIDLPPFIASNTTSIEVSKVTLSDTATVLHIYSKYRPKQWIRIATESYLKDDNGKTYPLRSGIGITPGENFWMPESGEAEFQLVFPPLSGNVSSIDFTEGEGIEEAFSIWGIQLKKKELPKLVLPKEAVVHKMDEKATLPEIVIKHGKATIKGKFMDFCPGMIKELTLQPEDPIKGYGDGINIAIEPDGSFNTTLSVTGTTLVNARIWRTSFMFFVEPDQTSEIYVNLREICRKRSRLHQDGKTYGEAIYINGPMAAIATEMSHVTATKTSFIEDYEKMIKKAEEMNYDTYKSYMLDKSVQIQQNIDKQPTSQALKQLFTLNKELSFIMALQSAPSILTQAYLQKNNLGNEAGREYYMKIAMEMPVEYIPGSYYQNINNPQTMLTPDFISFVRRSIPMKRVLPQLLGTDKGYFFDVLNAASFYQGIKDFNPLNDEQDEEFKKLPIAYQEMLKEANEELLAKIEANKKKSGFTVNEAGEVSNEDLFASIISKFRGKVLLVDFWATWCGPCRMANKAMIPMKEELKDKDIVYLYIAGENSPLKTWENMIPDIHGEHYRLTTAQWKYLSNSFKIGGVPTYIIVDRDGNIKFKQTGFPGVNDMKKKLLEIHQ